MRRHIHDLMHNLGITIPPLPYCPRCGGHYPPHSH
jgi:hypothetical protein